MKMMLSCEIEWTPEIEKVQRRSMWNTNRVVIAQVRKLFTVITLSLTCFKISSWVSNSEATAAVVVMFFLTNLAVYSSSFRWCLLGFIDLHCVRERMGFLSLCLACMPDGKAHLYGYDWKAGARAMEEHHHVCLWLCSCFQGTHSRRLRKCK